MSEETTNPSPAPNFLRQIIEQDLETGKYGGQVVTRFPPEPNGYLHIGHAKSICLNFGLAADYGGRCHLRFDDTNPDTEELEYVENIQNDVRWLGFDWGEHLYFASDYFQQMYDYAEGLIRAGKAYVDSSSDEEIRAHRGSLTEPGTESPYRGRSVEENLDLFRRMRAGEFPDGAHVLRAKGDMSAANMKMRDPLLYRIRHASHYRSGDAWCIYPMYDYAHCLEDAFEGITHSICTLEFENNRAIYDWVLEEGGYPTPLPRQHEFARLALTHTMTSKRRLLHLVREGHVRGWDDPRMPTLAGLRRRGVRPEAIRAFCDRIGVAKANSLVDMTLFEHSVRDDLNYEAPRRMVVLDPLKVVLVNYPEEAGASGVSETLEVSDWPHDVPREGTRRVPFGRELYIERADFMENPPSGYRRLTPGGEVRLRYAYLIRCDEVVKDDAGEVVELRCTYDPASLGGGSSDGRRVKGIIHWVPAKESVVAEVRLYDRLFSVEQPGGDEFLAQLNPRSLVVREGARVEPSLVGVEAGARFQFERQGYFVADPDGTAERPVFNLTVALKDSWAKLQEGIQVAPLEDEEAAAPKATKVDRRPQRVRLSPEETRAAFREANPELAARSDRYVADLGLGVAEADLLTADGATADFFDEALAAYAAPASLAKWAVNELAGELKASEASRAPSRRSCASSTRE